MSNNNKRFSKKSWSLVLGSGVLVASQWCMAQTADLEACGNIDDKEKRLQCYDDVRMRNRQTPPAGPIATPATPATSAVPAPQTTTISPTPAAVSPPATPAVTAPLTKPKNEPFVAAIKTAKRRADGVLVVDLENGQRWQGPIGKDQRLPSAGENVTLKPGVLGSYFLIADKGLYLRVSRVQ